MRFAFIDENQGLYPVDEMCRVLEVSRSGFYKWKRSAASDRELEDERIKQSIRDIDERSKGRYGHRPVHRHLVELGHDCGRDRTLRLMGELGLKGEQSPRYKPQGTDSDHDFGYSPNLLKELDERTGKLVRKRPGAPDEIWVCDTTYLKVEGRWMYLATVMDLCSRRILGWSVSAKNDGGLVCQALLAASCFRGGCTRGIIIHSDRGSTYACDAYRALLSKLGMVQSMSAKGNCYDNAAKESFYGRFKVSSVRGEVFATEAELRALVFEYIELFYNTYRKHSSLGYRSPAAFEAKFSPPPMGGIGDDVSFTSN